MSIPTRGQGSTVPSKAFLKSPAMNSMSGLGLSSHILIELTVK